jgi:predicted  nucleic acid-binding Zn-ribbon protein
VAASDPASPLRLALAAIFDHASDVWTRGAVACGGSDAGLVAEHLREVGARGAAAGRDLPLGVDEEEDLAGARVAEREAEAMRSERVDETSSDRQLTVSVPHDGSR